MNDPKNGLIGPEDYVEPRCPLCMTPPGAERVSPVPLQRIAEKTDAYMGRRDFAGAERHLRYWLEEARAGNDRRGAFSLWNELMGFYRKQGAQEKAMEAARNALGLVDEVDRVSAGTCYVNCGTVCDAFGMPERALELFEQAKALYEENLPEGDPRLGGLYNNMALALVALRRWGEAYELYRRALGVMSGAPNGALEQAITYLNMADAVEAEHGFEKGEAVIGQYLEQAAALLDEPSLPRSGYYAFVCEKCAPGFDHYGWFAYAAELKERYEAIYAGT